jgi:uncharacterized membrane protein
LVVYLAGAIGLTMGYHVPLNDALARFNPPQTGPTWTVDRTADELTIHEAAVRGRGHARSTAQP